MTDIAASTPADPAARLSIGFVNWAHALDHYVMLVFPTVVLSLEVVYGRSYAELIALGTASFAAFGIFSLPAGWLGDRWSRRNMMALFYFGCGISLAAAAAAPNLYMLAVALFALGAFAAIYHPVGTALLIEKATHRGRSLAFNGVCGNLGVAFAAGITAFLAAMVGWRWAYVVPAVVCIVSGIVFLYLVPDDRHRVKKRATAPDVRFAPWLAATIFFLFAVIAVTAGIVFNVVTVALPKIIDDKVGAALPLILIGSVATVIFFAGAIAQLAVGRLVEMYRPHLLFFGAAVMQFGGVVWAAYSSGLMMLAAITFAVAGIYAQVTINDYVIARYTADAWRSRVYSVRYFLSFIVSSAAVGAIAFFYSRGGFDLVLGVTAAIGFGFVVATAAIAVLVNDAEREQAQVVQPAE